MHIFIGCGKCNISGRKSYVDGKTTFLVEGNRK
jgi:hypothetical protein